MARENHDLHDLLRLELEFLEDGGYGRSSHAPWSTPYIFEDSPTCLNFCRSAKAHSCNQCLLIQLVPPEFRQRRIPCRFIPLSSEGQNIDSLYRTDTQAEIESALGAWLRREITRMESGQDETEGAR